jgi:hypothetical protein
MVRAKPEEERLQRHGVGTVGTGRLARLTAQDLARLIEAERQPTRARHLLLTAMPPTLPEVTTKRRSGAAERKGLDGACLVRRSATRDRGFY